MKILCSKSGIQFNCDYFPAYLHAREVSHPIFHLSQKKLLSFIPKWAAQESLGEVDSYLLFLALLDSTQLVEWRTAVQFTQDTSSIVANNMEDLAQIVGKMNLITHPAAVFQRIAISPENNTLQNVHYWIANWETNIEDFCDGYVTQAERADLNRRELALEKLIKAPHREIVLASQIANWAEIAGQFPQFQVETQFGAMECSEYWKLIIRKCIKAESIFNIPLRDIQELIDHCEDNIEHGSIYAHTLMQILRSGADKNKNFLGLGDWDISQSSISYLIVSEDSVEKANFDLLVSTAPTTEPRLQDYPTRFEWLKAKARYSLSQSTASQSSQVSQTKGL
jgi:hypothetical protein